jgi:hypothetical protein
MGNIYFKASEEHHKIAYNVMSKYHSDLSKARVQIGLLLTLSNKEDQPAIKDGAFGLIKIVPVKDRVTKQFDVELIVDGDIWNKKPELRDPLIDHLLNKLEVKKPKPKKTDKAKSDDEEMDVLVDDIGRPVIKMRKCDLNAVAGFSEVASRHGDISIEVLQLKEMSSKIEAAIKEKESLNEIVS